MKFHRTSPPARWPALLAAVALVTYLPVSAASAASPGISEEAQQAYDRGLAQRESGHFAAAAREFAAAYSQISAEQRELRAAVLFDLVDAHRQAFASGSPRKGAEHPAAHLCAAENALVDFTSAEQTRKRGKKNPDLARAINLRDEVRNDFSAAKARENDLDCATIELPGSPDSPDSPSPNDSSTQSSPSKPLIIAGSVTTGLGLAFLGLMLGGFLRGQRAEAQGAALVLEMPTLLPDDSQLQAIDRRGRSGNAMAISGGVLGSLALITGITLLVVGAKAAKKSRQVAAWPALSPHSIGAGLSWRF